MVNSNNLEASNLNGTVVFVYVFFIPPFILTELGAWKEFETKTDGVLAP